MADTESHRTQNGSGNNIKTSPKQAGTSDREPFREIAHPSKHKRLTSRPHIPVPPPSLADEITRAEPMSTYNALANQLKEKNKTFI